MFIDFTGHGCVTCREMEVRVWSKPRVLRRLACEYVVLALYVADKYELPALSGTLPPTTEKPRKPRGAERRFADN